MRMFLLAAAAVIGLAGSASAAPRIVPAEVSAVQQVDWYCGPRCIEHRRAQRHHWQQRHWNEGRYYNGYPRQYYNNGYQRYGYR